MKRMNWGWRIVFAYIIFICGTAAWVIYAMTGEVDLVRADYYEESLKHDVTMAARGRANALHASASIAFDPSRNAFVIQLPKTQAESITGTVTLYRPNAPSEDRVIPLKPSGDGLMVIPATKLNRGIWEITADWSFEGKAYQLSATRTI